MAALVAGCHPSEPLARAGITLKPPDSWRPVERLPRPGSGSALAAWAGPGRLVAGALPHAAGTRRIVGRMIAEALANRLENLPGLRLVVNRTEKVGETTAARVEVVAPGTGDALAPSGTGTPIAPAGKTLVPTREVTLGFHRPDATLFLTWVPRVVVRPDRPGHQGHARIASGSLPADNRRFTDTEDLHTVIDRCDYCRRSRRWPRIAGDVRGDPDHVRCRSVPCVTAKAGFTHPPWARACAPSSGCILIGFALLGANGFYLSSVTALTWYLGATQQTFFYMLMVALHLLLGFVLIVPFLIFGFAHLATSWKRPNKTAIRFGLALLVVALVILVSGLVLVRLGGFEVRDPRAREVGYWLHVLTPLAAVALYVKHRLAGPRIRWEWARRFSVAVAGFVVLMGLLHFQDPRSFGVTGPKEGQAVLLSVGSRHGQRQVHPRPHADDGRLLPEMPQRCLRRLVSFGAP